MTARLKSKRLKSERLISKKSTNNIFGKIVIYGYGSESILRQVACILCQVACILRQVACSLCQVACILYVYIIYINLMCTVYMNFKLQLQQKKNCHSVHQLFSRIPLVVRSLVIQSLSRLVISCSVISCSVISRSVVRRSVVESFRVITIIQLHTVVWPLFSV